MEELSEKIIQLSTGKENITRAILSIRLNIGYLLIK